MINLIYLSNEAVFETSQKAYPPQRSSHTYIYIYVAASLGRTFFFFRIYCNISAPSSFSF